MVASTDIKWFASDNLNAPQLTNDWGVMIGVLDACLINGFSVQTLASLTAIGTTVTATFNTAHQYKQYQVIEISGAGQTEYNGQHRILTIPNANTITFGLATAPAMTTATGTIICKLAALDWEKSFSGTNKAAYRSKNILLASRPFLRIDNSLDPVYTTTYAKFAKVGIVESMTDIDTMSGVQAPYDSANPTKNWVGTGSGATAINGWARWYYSNASAVSSGSHADNATPAAGNRSWMIIGTKDQFYLLCGFTPTDTSSLIYGFGAFSSLLPTDSANTFLSSTLNNNAANNSTSKPSFTPLGATGLASCLVQRSYNQGPSAATAGAMSLGVAASVQSGQSNYILNNANTGICFADVFLIESNVLRAQLPLLKWLFQMLPYSSNAVFVDNSDIYIAKNFTTPTTNTGQILLKVGSLV